MTPKPSRAITLVAVLGLVLSVGAAPTAQQTQNEFVIKPPYAPAPELTAKPGAPKGTMHQLVMKSEDSKIYPGISRDKPGAVVPYERIVNVYVPAQYTPGSPAPFIVVQDGDSARYKNALPVILDNLIHEGRVPAMIAVMVHHGGSDGFGSERGLEYDTVSDRYTTFIETEVLPRVAKAYNIAFTTDPEGRATMGGSSGAACAWTMAWFHPELYRRVLSYSGTFVNQENPPHPEVSRGAWEYHQTLIPRSAVKPIRVWMHVSENDNGANREEASLHNWVLANQHMAVALRMKGYKYRYTFAEGAGHVDGAVVNQTLPSALEWLWEGYRAPTGSRVQERFKGSRVQGFEGSRFEVRGSRFEVQVQGSRFKVIAIVGLDGHGACLVARHGREGLSGSRCVATG